MSSFFSGTDETTISNWVNNKFLVAVVGNHKGEYKGKVAIKAPIPCQLNDIPVGVQTEAIDPTMEEEIKLEIAGKVTERKLQTITPSYTTYGGYTYKGYKEKKRKKESHKAKDHTEMLNYANWCLCDECEDLIADPKKHFNYTTHFFDEQYLIWTPRSLEQRQLAESRRLRAYGNAGAMEESTMNELALQGL
jgi:hypothetical protein